MDLTVLVTSLINQDRYTDALPASRAALDLARRLAVADRELAAVESSFVQVRLHSGAECEDARTVAAEVVRRYQRLAGEDPDTFRIELSMAVNHLHDLLPDPVDSAVLLDGYRALCRIDADTFRDCLIALVNNRCIRDRDAGRTEEALQAMDELLVLSRDPVDLAAIHNDRAMQLRRQGRYREALPSLEAAVGLSREFPAAVRQDNLWRIAAWLSNLGCLLADLGDTGRAVEPLREAVAVHRVLALTGPREDLGGLGSALNDLGTVLHDSGRHAEALAATEEGVGICRWTADPVDPSLARCLHNLAGLLAGAGRFEEALDAAAEAVSIRSRLADRDPPAGVPGLSHSLRVYAQVCVHVQRAISVIDDPAARERLLHALQIHAGRLAVASRDFERW